jgi:RNA polymerase sigma-70 factor (ECF subfamily)
MSADLEHLLETTPRDESQLASALVQAYGAYLERLALSILDDPQEAQDAVQETLIHAAYNLDRYQPGTNLRGWLTAIAVNVCRGMLRKRNTRKALERVLGRVGLFSSAEMEPEEAALLKESGNQLRQAVDQLEERQRIVILLRYVHGLSVPETAGILDLPGGTVYSRLHYTHPQLRGLLASKAQTGLRGGVE